MKQIVKPRNLLAFRIWLEKLGYQVRDLNDGGFSATVTDHKVQRIIPKSEHHVLVKDSNNGNQTAHKLGAEFEMHLASPDLNDEQHNGFIEAIANKLRVA